MHNGSSRQRSVARPHHVPHQGGGMKTATVFIGACGIVAAVLLQPTVACAQASDEAQIRALEDSFAAGVRAKDVDADAYRKDWEEFLNDLDGPVKFEITDLAVVADGNLGYSHSIQHVSGKNKKAEVLDLTVRVTDVYRKIDGHLAGEHGTRLSAGRSQHRNHSSAAVGLQSLHARR